MRVLIGVLLVASLSACVTGTGGSGIGAKDQVAAATQAWIDAMSSHDLERVVALYDPEAVLWGTTSPTLRDSPAAVRDYFNLLRTVPADYKVSLVSNGFASMVILHQSGTYTFIGRLVTLQASQLVVLRDSALSIEIATGAG